VKEEIMESRSLELQNVSLEELRKIINSIFDHIIHDLSVPVVSLDTSKNLYWNIPSNELFDVGNIPSEIDIGSLYDDWEFLQSVLKSSDNGVALMLLHVAPILRYIGEKVGQ